MNLNLLVYERGDVEGREIGPCPMCKRKITTVGGPTPTVLNLYRIRIDELMINPTIPTAPAGVPAAKRLFTHEVVVCYGCATTFTPAGIAYMLNEEREKAHD